MEVEEVQTNRQMESERARWRKATAIVDAATGIRLGPMARRRLNAEERSRFVELSLKVEHRGRPDVSRLNRKELSEWESHIEQASRRPGFFAAAREENETRTLERGMARIAAELRKPRRRVDLHEAGSITLPKLWAFDWFARTDPVLLLSHIGLLVFLWGQFENGECLIPGGYFETDDDGELVLYIPKASLGKQFDDDEQRLGWRDRLQHLVDNSFFVTERSGGFIRVKLGSRLRRVQREAA